MQRRAGAAQDVPATIAKAELFARLSAGLLDPSELARVVKSGVVPSGRRTWEWGLEVLDELHASRCDADAVWGSTLSSVVRSCERGRQWELAIKVLERARALGMPMGWQAHEAVLRACDVAGQWRQAINVLESMRKHGPPPSAATWGSVISACDRGSAVVRVLRLLDTMREDGVEPALITYSISAGACRRKLKQLANAIRQKDLSLGEEPKPRKLKRVVL